MAAIEQEILDKLARMNEAQKQRVLEFVRDIETLPQKTYSAEELLKLPLEERERLVAESLALAADEDFEIFEAYSEEDTKFDGVAATVPLRREG